MPIEIWVDIMYLFPIILILHERTTASGFPSTPERIVFPASTCSVSISRPFVCHTGVCVCGLIRPFVWNTETSRWDTKTPDDWNISADSWQKRWPQFEQDNQS